MFHDLCRFVSGSHSRRKQTACLQTRWPSCLHPAYCAVPTPLTRYRASGTSARPLRKMLYATFTSILFYIFVKQLNTIQSSYNWNGDLACSMQFCVKCLNSHFCLIFIFSGVWSWSSASRWGNIKLVWRTSTRWSLQRAKPRVAWRTSAARWWVIRGLRAPDLPRICTRCRHTHDLLHF